MAITQPLSAHSSNARWKVGVAILAVLLLSAPSAVGVYRALEPTRGAVAAGLAAAGFELAYLSLSLLSLRPELRRQARAVALGAVATAIALNGLADYAHRVPGGLESWAEAQRLFDPLALVLSIGESAPLAGLAFALASLLHRLAEEHTPNRSEAATWEGGVAEPEPTLSWAREVSLPTLQPATVPEATQAFPEACEAARYLCPSCGVNLSLGQYGAAKKHGHCRHCKEASNG